MIPLLDVQSAAAAIRAGRLIAMPTETVYGLGGDALNPEAVVRIFQAKGRPRFNPIICHLADAAAVFAYGRRSPAAERLSAFWPGPLTLLLPHENRIPSIVTAGSPLAGFRVPDHALALEFLRACETPVAAPSANRSGRRSPTTAAMVQTDYADAASGGGIAGILDGGPCEVGLESTVVAIESEEPPEPPTLRILRPGGISREALERAGFRVLAAEDPPASVAHAEGEGDAPLHAPGRLLKHYGPGVPLLLIERERSTNAADRAERLHSSDARRDAIDAALRELNPDAHPLTWLGFAGRAAPVPCETNLDLSATGDSAEAARELFAYFDSVARSSSHQTVILCETLPEAELGVAVNDRLTRAAARIIPAVQR